ncbi:MAG: TonB family protein [Myxococcota bacterium]|jgi:TonB family protein
MSSFSRFLTMRFGAGTEQSTLTLSVGSMLVAHAAFIAVAVAMPIPEDPKPVAEVENPITVDVTVVNADDEERDLEERDPEEIEGPDPVLTIKAPIEPRIALPWENDPIEWGESADLEGLEISEFDEPESDLKAIQPTVLDPEKPRPEKKVARRGATILKSISNRPHRTVLSVLSMNGGGFDSKMADVVFSSPEGGVVSVKDVGGAGLGGVGLGGVGLGGVGLGGGGSVRGTTSTTSERESYIRRVTQKLMKNVRYPQSARDRPLEGRVKIAITINSNGRIKSARIIRGSGDKALDGSVLRHVNKAKGLPKPPKSLGETVRFVTTFRFKLG